MRIAETVTFGGSSLEREAHLRGDAAAQARMWGAGQALALWRGKPLFASVDGEALAWLGTDHPEIATRRDRAIFLGQDGDRALFAVDMSDWQPQDMPDSLDQFLDGSEQAHPNLPAGHVFAELRRHMVRLSALDAEAAAMARSLWSWQQSHRFCAKCGQESVIAMAGWQRDCPACGAHHFPRTDPVVIMLITHGNSVLVGRSPGWPEGMYSLLAGFVEPGETLEAAVRREVFEEAGVRVGQVGYLASQPWPFPSSLMIGCRGEALSREITIDPNEIEDAHWVTREEMLASLAGDHPNRYAARAGAIARFLVTNWLADRLD